MTSQCHGGSAGHKRPRSVRTEPRTPEGRGGGAVTHASAASPAKVPALSARGEGVRGKRGGTGLPLQPFKAAVWPVYAPQLARVIEITPSIRSAS